MSGTVGTRVGQLNQSRRLHSSNGCFSQPKQVVSSSSLAPLFLALQVQPELVSHRSKFQNEHNTTQEACSVLCYMIRWEKKGKFVCWTCLPLSLIYIYVQIYLLPCHDPCFPDYRNPCHNQQQKKTKQPGCIPKARFVWQIRQGDSFRIEDYCSGSRC